MQIPGGACSRRGPLAGRSRRWPGETRSSSLMLYDLRAVLASSRAARRSGAPSRWPAPRPGRRGAAAEDLPMPELAAVKEKRKGPLRGRPASRRAWPPPSGAMQREREPRVLVYDPAGYARLFSRRRAGTTASWTWRSGCWRWSRAGSDARRSRAGGARARPRAGAGRGHGRAVRGVAARLRHLDGRRPRRAPAGRPRARRLRARGARRLDLLRPRGRARRGGPAARGGLGVGGGARRREAPGGAAGGGDGRGPRDPDPAGGRRGPPQGGAPAGVRRARPRRGRRGHPGAHRLRREPQAGGGLRVGRARRGRRPHPHPAERPGGGAP